MKKIALVALGAGCGEYSQFTKRLLNATVALYYLKAVLEKSGFEVLIIDQPNLGVREQIVENKLEGYNPDLILFSQFFTTRGRIKELINRLKNKGMDCLFGVGGHDSTFHSLEKPFSYELFDLVFQGPVLEIIAPVINKLKKGQRPEIKFYNTLAKTEDPDLLPVLEHNNYHGTGFLVGSFGCYSKEKGCDFCTTPNFCPTGWRGRSLDHVLKEARNLKEAGKKEYVFLTDDDSLMNLERSNKIILGLKDVGLKAMIMTKPSAIVKAEKQGMLKEWGNIVRVFLGLENGTESGLRELGKVTGDIEKYKKDVQLAYQILKSRGISVFTGHINFTGRETSFSQLRESASFLYELGEIDWTSLSQSWRPYPGTLSSNRFNDECWLEKSELFYHFLDSRIEKFHRFVFSLREHTDPLDNLMYSITDEMFIIDPSSDLWKKYWQLKAKWNEAAYSFFHEALRKFEGQKLINPGGFLGEVDSLKKEMKKLFVLFK